MTSQAAASGGPSQGWLLEIRGLKTHFFLDQGTVRAVDGVSLRLGRGKTLGIVGESGCGKSVTARSVLQIVDPPGRVVGGEMLYRRQAAGPNGELRQETLDLAKVKPTGPEMRRIRGKEISMIFQEPMTSLSPLHTIGDQIAENILLHSKATRAAARDLTIDLLRKVGIPDPEKRVDAYPHQLSGGMRQRTMIAMAIACGPALLIADEPTTALDVTTQAQIMELLQGLQEEMGMAILIITHDLGVVAEMVDDVAVMYLGEVVETGDVDTIFHDPRHPYMRALLRSIPRVGRKARQRLDTIKGMVPDPFNRPSGCPFHPRCPSRVRGVCDQQAPTAAPVGPDHEVSCLLFGAAGGSGHAAGN